MMSLIGISGTLAVLVQLARMIAEKNGSLPQFPDYFGRNAAKTPAVFRVGDAQRQGYMKLFI